MAGFSEANLKALLAIGLGIVLVDRAMEADKTRAKGESLLDALVRHGDIGTDAFAELNRRFAVEAGMAGNPEERIIASLAAVPGIGALLKSLMADACGACPVYSDGGETLPASEANQIPGLADEWFGDRYEFISELGRGGLGRVVEAHDRDFGREIAMKMMLPNRVSMESAERFLFEARATGRLSHPNIVPVHEIGKLRHPGGLETPYFTMMKIKGRDLAAILRDIAAGDSEVRSQYNKPRLLRIFEEACNAVSYAHDNGVLHRDLKPANIMVGNYGEVYVVDWGLAKLASVPDSPDAASRQTDSPDNAAPTAGGEYFGIKHCPLVEEMEGVLGSNQENQSAPKAHQENQDTPALTLEGTILGTPAYMPPEQAEGRIAEIDVRSDIYSLGAILYEILALRPPHVGRSAVEVISKVIAGEIPKPSLLAPGFGGHAQGKPDSPGPDAGDTRSFQSGAHPDPVPPELEEIAMRALSREKSRRFASARELADRIRTFLEGEKERELNRAAARAKISEGRALVAEITASRAELGRISAEAEEQSRGVKLNWPAERKRGVWALEDRAKALRRTIAEKFSEAGSAFQEALGFDRENAEAKAALADLYWDEHEREEKSGNEEARIRCENMVRRFNDGRYDARLRGDGRLSLRTVRRTCGCLLPARAGRLSVRIRGDAMDPSPFGSVQFRGEQSRFLPHIDVDRPDGRGMHEPDCSAGDVSGADVRVFRYRQEDRRLVLEGPVWEGRSPVKGLPLRMGSYLVLVQSPGMAAVRRPVRIGRCEEAAAEVALYSPEEVPTGVSVISRGAFIEGGEAAGGGTAIVKELPYDFFASVHPVTCGEYLEFLNDIDPDEAVKRVPREAPSSGSYWPRLLDGRFAVPTQGFLDAAPAPVRSTARKLLNTRAHWEEDWPVLGVSWFDAISYCEWKSASEGRILTLLTDEEWEKAARGADGRIFPFGDVFEPTFGNMQWTFDDGQRPSPVNCFPLDESPYGLRGMAGNAKDWCLCDPGAQYRDWRSIRGGSFGHDNKAARSGARFGDRPANVFWDHGFRLCARAWSS